MVRGGKDLGELYIIAAGPFQVEDSFRFWMTRAWWKAR